MSSNKSCVTCYIYTDVDGIYTADPKVVPEARVIPHLTYEEAIEMASAGAVVVHPRAVSIAWEYGVTIVVASSFNNNPGTIISEKEVEDV